jgi:GT2 family glycosyltransferase
VSAPFSFVIPARDTPALVEACIESVRRASPCAEIVVVDDGGEDLLEDRLRRAFPADPALRVLRLDASRGFAGAANLGLSEAAGDVLVCLNSDTELLAGSLAALGVALDARPRLGVAGAALSYPDGGEQWSGGREPGLLWLVALASGLGARLGDLRRRLAGSAPRGDLDGHGAADATAASVRDVDWVSGAALAIRRDCWAACGPLSEDFAFYAQDLDFCCRARESGFAVAVVHDFRVVHHHGATIAGRTSSDRRQPGAPGRPGGQRVDLLWSDLLLWYRERHGALAARRAARAMRIAARTRRLFVRHAPTRDALARAIARIARDPRSEAAPPSGRG